MYFKYYFDGGVFINYFNFKFLNVEIKKEYIVKKVKIEWEFKEFGKIQDKFSCFKFMFDRFFVEKLYDFNNSYIVFENKSFIYRIKVNQSK